MDLLQKTWLKPMKLFTCLNCNTHPTAVMSDGRSGFATPSFHYRFGFYTGSSSGDVLVALHMLDSNCRDSTNSTNNVVS